MSGFVPRSNFFPVFVTSFSSSLKQEKCLEKVTNSWLLAPNLPNLFSTQFSCFQELGKQVTYTVKTFSQGKYRQLQQQNTIFVSYCVSRHKMLSSTMALMEMQSNIFLWSLQLFRSIKMAEASKLCPCGNLISFH